MNFDFSLLIPEYLLGILAALIIAVDLFVPRIRKEWLAYLAAIGLAGVLVSALAYIGVDKDFGTLIRIDDYTTFFRVLFIGIALVVCLISAHYVPQRLRNAGEYYGLIIVSTIGAIGMAAGRELLTAYISLELLSFSLYTLVSFAKRELRSNEGGLKYMLLGAFSSALFLYGLSILYGVAGSTHYEAIAEAMGRLTGEVQPALLLSLVLLMAGLGFKVAAVPFHVWTPDAYEGAPLPITAYLSATSKAAGFALILRLFNEALLPAQDNWQWLLVIISAATMVFGNLVALQQHNIKRLLAYSSIGQVGYMMMAIAVLSPTTDAPASTLLLHLAGYAVTNLAAFAGIIGYYNQTGEEEIAGFAGMAERQPVLAMVLAVSLFSLAGLPFFAGFLTKFMLFASVAQQGYLWLAGLAVAMSLVSLYYYLQVMRQLYIEQPVERTRFLPSPVLMASVAVLLVGVILIGIYPQPLFTWADRAAEAIMPSPAFVRPGP